ncbi:MAG: hypothetical protein O7D33_07940 [Chloroflexi bacterium]|nr:hypothetical protein [Chloroflexota bacterium]
MELSYEQGTLLWYWFEYWLVAVGFVSTVLLMVLVVVRSDRSVRDALPTVLMLVAVLAVLPLALMRLGVEITVVSDYTVGYLSLFGAVGSMIVGIPRLMGMGSLTDREWKGRTSEAFETADTICDYVSSVLDEGSFGVEERKRATLLAMEKLPPILHLIKAYPDPKSPRALRARRDFQRALEKFIAASKLARQLFIDWDRGVENIRLRLTSEQAGLEGIDKRRAQVAAGFSLAAEDMAKTRSFFLDQHTYPGSPLLSV